MMFKRVLNWCTIDALLFSRAALGSRRLFVHRGHVRLPAFRPIGPIGITSANSRSGSGAPVHFVAGTSVQRKIAVHRVTIFYRDECALNHSNHRL